MRRKLPVIFVFLFFLLFKSPFLTFADENPFTTAIVSTYTVENNQIMNVDQRVTLTNKTADMYVKEYSLTLPTDDIANVSARDTQGNIIKEIKKNNKQSQMIFSFNDKVIGKEQSLTFRISYETKKLAKKQGRIWQIQIPAKPESDNLEEYTAILVVPSEFPDEFSSKPQPYKIDGQRFLWSEEQLEKAGAVVYFNSSQYYQAELQYKLINESIKPQEKFITLPPDTAYQKVILTKIEPAPLKIDIDKDGNWLSFYKLSPKEVLSIKAVLGIETFLKPRSEFQVELNPEDKELYLRSQEFWETENPVVKKLAKELGTPKEIYRYVVNSLSYNYKKAESGEERFGAVKSLENKDNAVCTEFTDLFISLSRAAGVPAREINGFAFTQDDALKPLSLLEDTLHAWPEYYDSTQKSWQPVDPTWGNTTGGIDYFKFMDFDHITFAIHGLSSTKPPAAGDFKIDSENQKDIHVSLIDKMPEQTNLPLSFTLDFPDHLFVDQGVHGYLKVINPNNVSLYNSRINFDSGPLKLTEPLKTISLLPPYASFEIPLSLIDTKQPRWVDITLQAKYNSSEAQKTITLIPKFALYLIVSSGTMICLIFLGLVIYKIKKKK